MSIEKTVFRALEMVLGDIGVDLSHGSYPHTDSEPDPSIEALAAKAVALAKSDTAWKPAADITAPLIAVQSRMGLGNEAALRFYAPNVPNWHTQVFPVASVPLVSEAEHAVLRAEWERGLAKLQGLQGPGLLDSLTDLVEHCFGNICLPGAAQDLALSDIARSAMAFAASLTDNPDEELLLVSGGISGIQEYLYAIGSENAARIVSGRSWYLEMLVLAVQQRLREQFGLLRSQTIYASGGKFLLLMRGDAETVASLKVLVEEMEDSIYQEHRTALSLHIQWAGFTAAEVRAQGLQPTLNRLNKMAAADKQRKFQRQMAKRFGDFFEADAREASPDRDGIDNAPLHQQFTIGKGEDEIPVNRVTKLQFDLTSKLNGAEFIAIYPAKGTGKLSHDAFMPCNLGICFRILDKGGLENWANAEDAAYSQADVYRINGNTDDDTTLFPDQLPTVQPRAYGRILYGGKRPPVVLNDDNKPTIASYNDLSGDSGELSRMGVLRMDVDSLGSLIKSWASPGQAQPLIGPARITAISRRLDQFFKARLEALRFHYFEHSVILHYAGGDDLFAVGRWDQLIEFAERVRADFRVWIGDHPGTGLSGGIAIVPVKFPVGRAAVLAGEGEDKAKAHWICVDTQKLEKDAVCLLGVPLRWDKEYEVVKGLKEEMGEQISASDGLSKSLIPKIHSHYLAYQAGEGRKKLPSQRGEGSAAENQALRWRWNLVWDIARMIEEKNESDYARRFLLKLKADVFEDQWRNLPDGGKLETPLHTLELYRLASRWAELDSRTFQD